MSWWNFFFGKEDDPPKDPKLIHAKYLITEQIKKSKIILLPTRPLKLVRCDGIPWKQLKIDTDVKNVRFSEDEFPPLGRSLPLPIPGTPRKNIVCPRADFINHPQLPKKP